MVRIMPGSAIDGIPDHGQQVQRQQVHCVEQKIQTNTVSARGATSLRLLAL
jgi:hypothetical protein